jgi:thymidine phosphorylase
VVHAPTDGIVSAIDVRGLGLAVVALGGGRQRADDVIDPAVGLLELSPLGRAVKAGEPLALVDARNETDAARAAMQVAACYILGERGSASTPALPAILERIG